MLEQPFLIGGVVSLIILGLILWLLMRKKESQSFESLPAHPVMSISTQHAAPEGFSARTDVPLPHVEIDSVPNPRSSRRDSDLAKTSPNPLNIKKMITAQEKLETAQETASPRLPGMNWQAVGLSDVGLKRGLNEDSWEKAEILLTPTQPCGVYILSDGMGGHLGGEIASRVTVEAIKDYFLQRPPLNLAEFESWLQKAAAVANDKVIAEQGNQSRSEKMGATLVAALVADSEAYIVNVGDSRGYLLNDSIKRLTRDHSLVERLVELGQITEDEARYHPQKNVIYSTIGDRDKMQVDVFHCVLQPGDRLLLCSDGLSGMVEDGDLLKLSLSHPDPAAACQAMINAANEGGGKDNITAVIVQLDAS